MSITQGADPGRRRLLRAGTAVGLLPLLPGCAGPVYLPGPAEPPPLPTLNVSERWRYERFNVYNGQSLGLQIATVAAREADGSLRLALTDGQGAPAGEERYLGPWQVLLDLSYDQPQRFAQPMPLLPPRLAAGEGSRLSTDYQVPGASGRFRWSQWLRAPGWERVSVPAGEFDCLRVERLIHFSHSDVFREMPQRRDTIWYAPAVRRWVRREWTGYYYWPGQPPTRLQEDWVVWQLLDHTPAPIAG